MATFASCRRALPLVLLVVGVAAAHADDADDARKAADRLVIEGKKLGDAGRVTEAIERFKAAEAKYPRAIHGCNIALAYAQLKSYPQALLFLEQCRLRATGPLPGWVEARYQKTLETLRAGGYGPVEIVSDPPGADVEVATFARDETFQTPRTIWLATGDTDVTFTREGYEPERRTLTVSTQPQRLDVKLRRVPPPRPPDPVVIQPPKPDPLPVAPTPAPPAVEQPIGRADFKIAGAVLIPVAAIAALGAVVPIYLDLSDRAVPKGDEKYPAFNSKRKDTYQIKYPVIGVVTGLALIAGVGLLVAGLKLPGPKSKKVSLWFAPSGEGASLTVTGRW